METSNGLSNLRNSQHTGIPPILPPKRTSEAECSSHSIAEFEGFSEAKERLRGHQRAYSDSMLSEEVPSWLKELLDEPVSPLCKSHRRSSSDSIAYLQLQITAKETESKEHKSKQTFSSTNTCYVTFPTSVTPQDEDVKQSHMSVKQNVPDSEGSFVQHRSLHSNPYATKPDSKRVKSLLLLEAMRPTGRVQNNDICYRHSAQQNRARKVQYIAELERTIQVLQAEGYGVSADLEFLDQQNLILGMENRALKQRLDSLSQVHFIKCLEQEMLEKEITRLRNLYQQQQQHNQQQLKHYGRPRSKSQDFDSSFAKLLKHKGAELPKANSFLLKSDIHEFTL
ncbi:basic leucine zipper 34-like [Gastrolobium bilobum]|uniref:basic leucine zipper 34-like n=1 Tax=Gastrolobium bilobum TaxID=150636 RepID=UPI002AB07561|nr:basic leucine zipper 34-like [Gastrolobium bilobum]